MVRGTASPRVNPPSCTPVRAFSGMTKDEGAGAGGAATAATAAAAVPMARVERATRVEESILKVGLRLMVLELTVVALGCLGVLIS